MAKLRQTTGIQLVTDYEDRFFRTWAVAECLFHNPTQWRTNT